MSYILNTYSFDHVAKTVTLTNYTAPSLGRISAILNVTRGLYMYRADTPATLGGTLVGNVLTLVLDTTGGGFANTDVLAIGYNDVFVIDNQALNEVIRPLMNGGKAVDVSAYTPGYTAGDAAVQPFNKDNGAPLVNQGNLDPAFDGVKSYAIASSSSITGLSYFRTITANNAAQTVKAAAGNIFAWRIINATATVIYLKFYNKTGATSADTPFITIAIPTAIGSSVINNLEIGKYFSAACSIRCVTGIADNDNTSPLALPIIEIDYV